jgi:hypothetical protein
MSILLAALLLSTDPTGAPPVANATTPAQSSAPAKPQKEKKICRADPTETGSHMVKRICLTQDQWDAQRGRTTDEFNSSMPNGH